MREIGHFIGGREQAGEGQRVSDVFQPATGSLAARVRLADAATVERAVAVARQAAADWAETPPLRRARVLFRFRELLEAQRDALAALVTQEHGKVLEDGKVRSLDVKVGDKILFGKYSGTEVKVDGDDLLVMREEDIMAIIEGK